MVAIQPLVSEFTIIGKLSDFTVDSKGRVKYLYLSTPEAEYAISVAKQQKIMAMQLQPGCSLKVSGMRKNKLHKGEIEYKAYRIELLELATAIDVAKRQAKKAQILVCQGKSCCQHGAKTVCESLRSELHKAGLTDTVEIKTTGCIKQCKQAPNLVVPGKKRYSRVKSEQISGLVKNYF